MEYLIKHDCRVAEVVRRCQEPLPKSLDSDENFKTLDKLFCRDVKICPDLHTFWKSLAKKVLLGVKKSVSWARSALFNTWYILHIILMYICNYAQKRRICRQNSKYVLDDFLWPFLPSPKGCQLLPPCMNVMLMVIVRSMFCFISQLDYLGHIGFANFWQYYPWWFKNWVPPSSSLRTWVSSGKSAFINFPCFHMFFSLTSLSLTFSCFQSLLFATKLTYYRTI